MTIICSDPSSINSSETRPSWWSADSVSQIGHWLFKWLTRKLLKKPKNRKIDSWIHKKTITRRKESFFLTIFTLSFSHTKMKKKKKKKGSKWKWRGGLYTKAKSSKVFLFFDLFRILLFWLLVSWGPNSKGMGMGVAKKI